MKITRQQLKQIIKEELLQVLQENEDPPSWDTEEAQERRAEATRATRARGRRERAQGTQQQPVTGRYGGQDVMTAGGDLPYEGLERFTRELTTPPAIQQPPDYTPAHGATESGELVPMSVATQQGLGRPQGSESIPETEGPAPGYIRTGAMVRDQATGEVYIDPQGGQDLQPEFAFGGLRAVTRRGRGALGRVFGRGQRVTVTHHPVGRGQRATSTSATPSGTTTTSRGDKLDAVYPARPYSGTTTTSRPTAAGSEVADLDLDLGLTSTRVRPVDPTPRTGFVSTAVTPPGRAVGTVQHTPRIMTDAEIRIAARNPGSRFDDIMNQRIRGNTIDDHTGRPLDDIAAELERRYELGHDFDEITGLPFH